MTPPQGLLISDVDSTFLTQEVIELVAEHAGVREEVAAVTDAAMRGELDFTESLARRVALLEGLDQGVLDLVRDSLVPTPGACDLFLRAHEHGWVTALVSGGFTEVITPLARQCRVTHVVANRFEIAAGRLTGRTDGPVVDGRCKEKTLRALAEQYGLPLERTVAIGDGANDTLMVQAAGLGIAFKAKPALRRVADAELEGPSLLDAWPLMQAQIAEAGATGR